MEKLIKFPSIEQFRHVVGIVNRHANFVKVDENGEAIYDANRPKPTLKFKGTIKLHGTNAGVCFNNTHGMWIQSRERIITPLSDNAGFAFFVESKRDVLIGFFNYIADTNDIDLDNNTISIYFEWAGSGIQKNVGISEIKKSAFIIGVKVTPHSDLSAYWVDSSKIKNNEQDIYNILDFKTYEMDIDFNNPNEYVNKIVDLTLEVEEECPVAKHFGFSGIGEGIVWSTNFEGNELRFKSKGEKHANSKVKTLKPVDNERINKIIEIAQKVTPTWRLEQMINETFDIINGGVIDRAKLGNYMKAVTNDIVKEDMDIIVDAELELKDITKYVSQIARDYFFEYERNNLGV